MRERERERESPVWMAQNWYAAHIIFLSSPTWFALTLFKMEEEISLSGVSCPQVHDHSDLMCTASVISREGHNDLSLKVGLCAIESDLSVHPSINKISLQSVSSVIKKKAKDCFIQKIKEWKLLVSERNCNFPIKQDQIFQLFSPITEKILNLDHNLILQQHWKRWDLYVLHYWDNCCSDTQSNTESFTVHNMDWKRRTSAVIEVQMVNCQFRQSSPLLHPSRVMLLLQHPHFQCLLIIRNEDSAPSSCCVCRQRSATAVVVTVEPSAIIE